MLYLYFYPRKKQKQSKKHTMITATKCNWYFTNSIHTWMYIYLQASRDSPYLPRHTGLRIGLNVHTPALAVNRLCGSGFQSLVNGCQVCN